MKLLQIVLVFIFSLCSVYNHTAFGQSNGNESQFGLKGGFNFSNLYTDEVDDNNILTSINAGVYKTISVTSFIAIQAEFLYSRKGAELVYNNALANGTAKFNLNYFEIPLLLKINPTKTFNVHAGPYAAYLVSAKIKNVAQNNSFNFEQDINTDDFRKFDYGMSGGMGLDYGSLGFGLRYSYGMASVGKEQNIGNNSYRFPGGKNSNLSIYAAIRLL